MKDIYDIQTFLFGFLYSGDYFFILFWVIFFAAFYFLLQYFFWFKWEMNKKIEKVEDDGLKERLRYLVDNISSMERDIFYREVGVFLKTAIYKEFQDKSVFFMTLSEIEKHFANSYNSILKEVYYLEFDGKREDSLDIRKNILKKIEV